jgi:ABC-type bacteriocin/lantibiotic exporter with double-glycine peptidase domain
MTNPKSDVFCPNCSAKNKIEQNFCRFCGFNLQETKKSLAAQLSLDKNASRFNQLKLIKRLTDVASIVLAILVSSGIIFFIYAVLTNMVFSGKRVWVGIFLIYLIFEFVIRQIRRIKRRKIIEDEAKTSPLASELTGRETAKLLEEKPFEPAQSITENTTGLLYAEQKTKKFE